MPTTTTPKRKVTLVVTAPDLTEITIRTAAGYRWAGLVQREKDGPWHLVAKGWSHASVQSRTKTAASGAYWWVTSPLRMRTKQEG